jgi:hypothetical protein
LEKKITKTTQIRKKFTLPQKIIIIIINSKKIAMGFVQKEKKKKN